MALAVANTASKSCSGGDYSITGAAIGAADSTRIVVVGVAAQGDTTTQVTAISIGGSAGTKIVETHGVNSSCAALYALAVPSGTTANISITFSGSAPNFGCIGVWAITGGCPTAADTSGTDSAEPFTLTTNIAAGGIAICCNFDNVTGGATVTYTNLTADFFVTPSANAHAGGALQAFAAAQTGITLTADWTGTANFGSGVFGVWNPSVVGIEWVSFFEAPVIRNVHRPRKRKVSKFLWTLPRKKYTTPPQPSNLSWFQPNKEVLRKPTKPRKHFNMRFRWKLPRMLAYIPPIPPERLPWRQYANVLRRPTKPRKRFTLHFVWKKPREFYGVPPQPSNLSWWQQNPIMRRKPMRPRRRYVIRFRHLKVPKAYVTPPPPSNLSWLRNPKFAGLKKARGRKRFFIHGRWFRLPWNEIGEFVPITFYSASGPGKVKWRNKRPSLERERAMDPELQK